MLPVARNAGQRVGIRPVKIQKTVLAFVRKPCFGVFLKIKRLLRRIFTGKNHHGYGFSEKRVLIDGKRTDVPLTEFFCYFTELPKNLVIEIVNQAGDVVYIEKTERRESVIGVQRKIAQLLD